ncbi:MAG: molybdopterin-dependent oxidoreductase [Actinomycetota bacterium]|jgi:anaerobic selenocysteine-containing dehydrogenase
MTATEERITFCRICEACCGMVATLEGGRVTKLRADKENPFSDGYICPKGPAYLEVHNDPDRVLQPLKRQPDGTFTPVPWDEALDDIAGRLRALLDTHGSDSVGWYVGNQIAFNYSAFFWILGFMAAIKSPHFYAAASVDINNRWAASAVLYGHPLTNPIPDLEGSDFLFLVGTNPFVSHGSMWTVPRIRERLLAMQKRGGRVIVVDPRRTETAEAFEHLPIRPDGDAWLLASMLHVIFAEGLADEAALAAQTTGVDVLRRFVAAFPPEATEARTGIPADQVRQLARDAAGAKAAAFFGRCGASLGRHSTLVVYLLDALTLVTGNFDRPGGLVFGRPMISSEKIAHQFKLDTFGRRRSRVGGFPDLLGTVPIAVIPKEITTPGSGQLRALLISAGNPVTSAPNRAEWEDALPKLDLLVSMDFYVTETNRHADYILPATTFLERDDYPWFITGHMTPPYAVWTDAVEAPRGEARPEWWVVAQLGRRLKVEPSAVPAVRALGKLGIRLPPAKAIDLFLRTGPEGDFYGLRPKGLSLKKLRREPRGRLLADRCDTGVLGKRVFHKDRLVHFDHPEIRRAMDRFTADVDEDPEFPLRLISLRELRSHNTWFHNVGKLMRERRQYLRIHPKDAAEVGVEEGDAVAVVSKTGRVEVPVRITDEMTPGVLALPQGWGHRGGWRTAVEAGGANYNDLTSSDPADLDVSGNAVYNAVPVRLEPV